jgi:hypothetical protein
MESLARTQESEKSLPPQQSLAWAMESLARTQESQQSLPPQQSLALARALEAQQGLTPQQSLPAVGERIVSKGLHSVMGFLPAACIVFF